jgi:hypothetical protein
VRGREWCSGAVGTILVQSGTSHPRARSEPARSRT